MLYNTQYLPEWLINTNTTTTTLQAAVQSCCITPQPHPSQPPLSVRQSGYHMPPAIVIDNHLHHHHTSWELQLYAYCWFEVLVLQCCECLLKKWEVRLWKVGYIVLVLSSTVDSTINTTAEIWYRITTQDSEVCLTTEIISKVVTETWQCTLRENLTGEGVIGNQLKVPGMKQIHDCSRAWHIA